MFSLLLFLGNYLLIPDCEYKPLNGKTWLGSNFAQIDAKMHLHELKMFTMN